MGRSPCCSKEGLNRGAWTAREDKVLRDYITIHGEGRWRNLPKKAGLKRCGKSCRLRWLNYLRPDIKRGNISADEEELIIRLHKLLGNRWSLIAGRLPGRTDNEIKNYWNTTLVKKVQDLYTISAKHPKRPNHHNKSSLSTSFKMGSHVIKTKAIKCSKIFINQDSHKTIQHSDTNPDAATSVDDNKPIQSDDTCINNTPSDFMVDFNMEDFSLSDLLNPEFPDLCGFTTHMSNELSPSNSDHVFSDGEMLLDNFWTTTDNDPAAATENVASYLSSFASFLDSREECGWDDV